MFDLTKIFIFHFSLIITLLIIIVSTIVLISTFYIRYKLSFWKRQRIPYSVTHLAKSYRYSIPLTDQNSTKEFGKIFGSYQLLTPAIFISEPNLINIVLKEKFNSFGDKQSFFLPEDMGSSGLFTLPYKPWKRSRKIISHAFSTRNLNKMVPLFEESVNYLTEILEKYSLGENAFNIKHYIDCCLIESQMMALYGARIDSKYDSNHSVICNFRKVLSVDLTFGKVIALFLPFIRRLFSMTVFDKSGTTFAHNLCKDIIDSRKSMDKNYNDFIQFLLNAENIEEIKEKTLSEKEVIDNSMQFFIAAYDTTSSTICHLLIALALNPEIQNKLFKEIDSYSESKNQTIDDLPYLDACLKESLRLWPGLTRLERVAVEDTYLDNIFIPKNAKVYIPVYSVHRDSDNFENPEQYIPERFLSENKYKIKPGTYIPFADGPRNCIGKGFAIKQIKVMVSGLLKKYRLIACEESKNIKYHNSLVPVYVQKKAMIKINNR